jgi:hypothetical protein
VMQRDNWDCGVACLAMLTGRSYEEELASLGKQSIDLYRTNRGINTAIMPALLGERGFAVRTTFARFDQPWSTGLTGLRLADVRGHYVVVLPDDRVLDPGRGERHIRDYAEAFHVWEIHDLARLTRELEEAREAARTVCPDKSEDEDGEEFVCLGETGDPIIEANTVAEVIQQMSKCWEGVQEQRDAATARAEKLEKALRAIVELHATDGYRPGDRLPICTLCQMPGPCRSYRTAEAALSSGAEGGTGGTP